MKNHAMAIYYATRALQRDPGCLRAYIVRAESLYRQGDLMRAVSELRRVLSSQPDLAVHRALHVRYLLATDHVALAASDCWSLARAWMALRRPPLPLTPSKLRGGDAVALNAVQGPSASSPPQAPVLARPKPPTKRVGAPDATRRSSKPSDDPDGFCFAPRLAEGLEVTSMVGGVRGGGGQDGQWDGRRDG